MKIFYSIISLILLLTLLITTTVIAQVYPEDPETFFSPQSVADKVYINANVITVDRMHNCTKASAFAVKNGWFIYVGDEAGVQSHIGPGTLVFDLGGKTVIPGLHDSHMHYRLGARELYPQTPDIREELGKWASVERMQAVIKDCLATGKGIRVGKDGQQWLVLSGWMSDVWDPPVFHRKLIDEVCPDIPVYITRYTHGSGCNTKALELAGITKDTPDPEGGHIKKDEQGEVTGEFVERAPQQLLDLIPPAPPYTFYEDARNFVEGQYLALKVGLTMVHEASQTSYNDAKKRLALYEGGIMLLRMNDMISPEAAKQLGAPINYNNRYINQTVKQLADGAMGSRGAWLLEEYSDYPGYFGEPRVTAEQIAELGTELIGIGYNLAIHAIGDAANRAVINGYEKALKNTGADPFKVRFRIEHCQTLTPQDIPRLAPLGLIASMQPLHAIEDMHFSPARLGSERIKGAYIWRTLLDLGVVVSSGTDYSVSPYNPFYTIHAAVTRQDRNNNPSGGWYKEQAMTREEALWSATWGGAYAAKMEDIYGSIEKGKLADFVVIPVDILDKNAIADEDLWKIEVDMTVIGGEIAYKKPVVVK